MKNRTQLMQYPPEKKIGDYSFSFKALLGRGSYGSVYFGKNQENSNQDIICQFSDNLVAIKVIDHQILKNQAAKNMINQEIQIMKMFNHPNIVKLIDVLYTANNTYIISEYCDGIDLRQLLKEKRILPEVEAIKLLRDIVNGLKELHLHGIIHRDLKPANIIQDNNVTKLADFGFSRFTELPDFIMNSIVGTPLYMSPQLLKKESYTNKSDIWSLGLIYYELLYGNTPWFAQNLVELTEKIYRELIKFPKNVKVSQDSIDFIYGCLKVNEKDRFGWNEVFTHKLLGGRITQQIQINLENVDIGKLKQMKLFRPPNHTYRINKQENILSKENIVKLPEVQNRKERSSSQHNIVQVKFQTIVEIDKNEKNEENESTSTKTSNQSNENNTKIQQQKQEFYLRQPKQKRQNEERMRRTKSQLEGVMPVNITNANDVTQGKVNQVEEFFKEKIRNLAGLFTGLQEQKQQQQQEKQQLVLKKFNSPLSSPTQKSKISILLIRLIGHCEQSICKQNPSGNIKMQVMGLMAAHKKFLKKENKQMVFHLEARKVIQFLIKDLIKDQKIFESDQEKLLFVGQLCCYYNFLKCQNENVENQYLNVEEQVLRETEEICLISENKKEININFVKHLMRQK